MSSKSELRKELLRGNISQADFDKKCGISNSEIGFGMNFLSGGLSAHGAIWSSERNYKANSYKGGFSQMGRIGPNFAGVP
jgi:hypothetical protein